MAGLPELYAIEWEDAYNGNHDWFETATLPEAVEPYIVHTVGWVLQRNKERVTVAMSYIPPRGDAEARACDLFTIPAGMIRNLTALANPFAGE